jgi:hypothetical protein
MIQATIAVSGLFTDHRVILLASGQHKRVDPTNYPTADLQRAQHRHLVSEDPADMTRELSLSAFSGLTGTVQSVPDRPYPERQSWNRLNIVII